MILSWPEPPDEPPADETEEPPAMDQEQPEQPRPNEKPPERRSAEDILQELGF